ncbi:hypothetical protein HDU88_008003 [Geranomyces variabilis]|nr:hypothetical protein HDU88_008003 [Geranomyces variabilis]
MQCRHVSTEYAARSDMQNCGACGIQCGYTTPNSVPSCLNGPAWKGTRNAEPNACQSLPSNLIRKIVVHAELDARPDSHASRDSAEDIARSASSTSSTTSTSSTPSSSQTSSSTSTSSTPSSSQVSQTSTPIPSSAVGLPPSPSSTAVLPPSPSSAVVLPPSATLIPAPLSPSTTAAALLPSPTAAINPALPTLAVQAFLPALAPQAQTVGDAGAVATVTTAAVVGSDGSDGLASGAGGSAGGNAVAQSSPNNAAKIDADSAATATTESATRAISGALIGLGVIASAATIVAGVGAGIALGASGAAATTTGGTSVVSSVRAFAGREQASLMDIISHLQFTGTFSMLAVVYGGVLSGYQHALVWTHGVVSYPFIGNAVSSWQKQSSAADSDPSVAGSSGVYRVASTLGVTDRDFFAAFILTMIFSYVLLFAIGLALYPVAKLLIAETKPISSGFQQKIGAAVRRYAISPKIYFQTVAGVALRLWNLMLQTAALACFYEMVLAVSPGLISAAVIVFVVIILVPMGIIIICVFRKVHKTATEQSSLYRVCGHFFDDYILPSRLRYLLYPFVFKIALAASLAACYALPPFQAALVFLYQAIVALMVTRYQPYRVAPNLKRIMETVRAAAAGLVFAIAMVDYWEVSHKATTPLSYILLALELLSTLFVILCFVLRNHIMYRSWRDKTSKSSAEEATQGEAAGEHQVEPNLGSPTKDNIRFRSPTRPTIINVAPTPTGENFPSED